MTNNTWQITPIGEQIELLTDYTANGSFAGLKQNVQYYNQSNYAALVRTTDLEKKVFAPERFTDKKGYDFLKKSSLTGGEIVLANVGSIGKVYRVPQYNLPMTLAPNMYLIRFKESIDKNYAFQYLTSQIFQKKLLSNVASTTLSAINKSNLRSITIPVPPLEVQHRIGDILSSIDEAIQKTDQIIQKSEQLKQGLISNLFNKEVQANWVIYKLGDATKFIDYRGKTPTKVQEGIPLITAKNVRMGFIEREPREYIRIEDYDSWMTRGIPREGDVLFTTEAPLGNVAQIDTDEKLAFAQRVIIIQPIKEVNSTFLKYLLMSDQIQLIIKSLSTGGTVKGIKAKVLKQIEIPVPLLKEQQEIAEMMTHCDEKISKEKKFMNKLLTLKAGLMHDIFNQKVQIN